MHSDAIGRTRPIHPYIRWLAYESDSDNPFIVVVDCAHCLTFLETLRRPIRIRKTIRGFLPLVSVLDRQAYPGNSIATNGETHRQTFAGHFW